MRDTSKPVVCHECGGYFTASGLRMHAGSAKCRLNQRARPLQLEVEKEHARLKSKGKHVVVTNVALALERRNLEEVCGLEKAGTKLLHTDLNCYILDQYWVHDWVYRIWQRYNQQGYTRTAYSQFEKLAQLSERDRQAEIGMIMLHMLSQDG